MANDWKKKAEEKEEKKTEEKPTNEFKNSPMPAVTAEDPEEQPLPKDMQDAKDTNIDKKPVEVTVHKKSLKHKEETYMVKPRQSVGRFKFGGEWYTLKKGEPIEVSAAVRAHLLEKDLI